MALLTIDLGNDALKTDLTDEARVEAQKEIIRKYLAANNFQVLKGLIEQLKIRPLGERERCVNKPETYEITDEFMSAYFVQNIPQKESFKSALIEELIIPLVKEQYPVQLLVYPISTRLKSILRFFLSPFKAIGNLISSVFSKPKDELKIQPISKSLSLAPTKPHGIPPNSEGITVMSLVAVEPAPESPKKKSRWFF